MMRIGVTQRVDVNAQTGERRDALDQHWTVFLEAVGLLPMPLPNRSPDPAGLPALLELDGVLLTGGNDLAHMPGARMAAPERDALETALVKAARAAGLPVLGVCRGAQMLNHLCGGDVVAMAGHVVPRHRVIPLRDAGPVLDTPFEVASYHDHGIAPAGLGQGLRPLAQADDGSIEAFRDGAGLLAGILWHPEREAPFRTQDIDLFRRFFGRQPW